MRHSDLSGKRVLVDLMHSHRPRGLDQTFFSPQIRVAVHVSLKMWPFTDCSVNSVGERLGWGRFGWLCECSQDHRNVEGSAQLFLCFSLSHHLLSLTLLRAHTLVGFGYPFQSTLLLLLVWCREEADTLECLSAGGQAELMKGCPGWCVFMCFCWPPQRPVLSLSTFLHVWVFFHPMHLLYNWNK